MGHTHTTLTWGRVFRVAFRLRSDASYALEAATVEASGAPHTLRQLPLAISIRSVKEDLKLGICGEHGGEPVSVAFCHELGLDYVSFAVPGSAARLAAAQAALKDSGVEAVAAGG